MQHFVMHMRMRISCVLDVYYLRVYTHLHAGVNMYLVYVKMYLSTGLNVIWMALHC